MKNKILSNENFIFWFILADIFLLPYFNIVVIPISYFLIIWWVLNHRITIKNDSYFKEIAICILFMCISTALGCILYSEYGVIGDNIKRLIQYIITFQYVFFFKDYFRKHKPDLKPVLWAFVIFVVLIAILFQISPNLYSTVCTFWNKGNAYVSTSFEENIRFGYTLRYSFIWTDPNNIAYALTSVIMFMLCCFDTDWGEIIILFCANVYVLVNSMSSGGWVSFIISWFLFTIYHIFLRKKSKKSLRYIKKSSLIRTLIVLTIILMAFEMGYFSELFNSAFVQSAVDRFKNNENTRTEIWMRILSEESILWHLLVGKGSSLIINGVQRATHSGHLYWIYAYGFVSYLIMMKQTFWLGIRKIWRYIPIVGIFLCFTMNTMVGEQKLFLISVMIISYLREEFYDERYDQLDSSGLQC